MIPSADRLGSWLRAAIDAAGVVGASIGVMRDGVVTAASAGVLNRNTGVPVTVDSLFQIGSISKVWTTTLAMLLSERGELDLDAPVRQYLEGFRSASADGDPLTTRHLLTHTSGIDGDDFTDTGRGDDALARYAELCGALPQIHPVGTTFSYCNSGFNVTGRVLEVLTDRTWDELVRDMIIRPLRLTRTVTLPEEALLHRAAVGHIGDGERLVLAPVWSLPRSQGPAGGVVSTAADVLTFAAAHMSTGSLLEPASKRAMQTEQVRLPYLPGMMPDAWGLGWGLYEWDGGRGIGHDGGTIGQAAFLRLVPELDVAVVLLTNGGAAMDLYHGLFTELMEDAAGVSLPTPLHPSEPRPSAELAKYVGTYEREGWRIDARMHNGSLKAELTFSGILAAGSESMPQPLPLLPVAAGSGRFITSVPGTPGKMEIRFGEFAGRPGIHVAGRLIPMVESNGSPVHRFAG